MAEKAVKAPVLLLLPEPPALTGLVGTVEDADDVVEEDDDEVVAAAPVTAAAVCAELVIACAGAAVETGIARSYKNTKININKRKPTLLLSNTWCRR